MPIIATDIHYRMSGGASNSDPALALGGAKSSTSFTTNAIFDDVSSAEAAAGDTEYRCVYVHNAHGSLTLQGAKVWIHANTPSADTTVAIALGGEGLNGTAETVANENTAPSGETFSSPTDFAGGLTIGDLAPGQHYPVWVRRTINAGAASTTDTWTIRVQGDTNP
jgi:hypothetical protein